MIPAISFDSSIVAKRISELIGQPRYEFWFARRVQIEISNDELIVSAPNQHFVDLLSSRYRTQLEVIAREFIGINGTCRFVVANQKEFSEKTALRFGAPQENLIPPTKKQPTNGPQITTAYPINTSGRSIDDFIISDNNRMAAFSVRSFVESDSGVGLLVLVAPPSRGKSHLLEGLKNLCLSTQNCAVKHLDAESLISKLIDAIRKGKTTNFKRNILDCNMLLIDDLDKLEGKPSCQAEFLSILEIAKQNEIKIAVSMGQFPRQTPGLNQMLVERLQSGLVCPVGPLDSIGKTRLLQQFLNRLGVGLVTEDFYHKAGDLLPESAREIEGIAQKVWLLGRLESRPIDLDLLKIALQDDSRPSCSPTIESIAKTVAGILGISAEAIIGRSKSPILEMGRMFSYYLARKHSCHSAAEVGAFFQGRSHSTIINGANQVEKRLANLNQANRWPQNWKLLLKQAGQILNKG